MWGGRVSLTLLTLLVIPAMYVIWRSFALGEGGRAEKPVDPSAAPAVTVG
jgi:copper/silver efflux system protein